MKATLKMALLLIFAAGLCGCDAEPRKTDAELGLNSEQAGGRHLFDRQCGQCHYAYTSRGLRGPSLQHLFHKPFMPSGTPANEERVREVIMMGRSKMPAYSRVLTQEQLDELIAYLRTL